MHRTLGRDWLRSARGSRLAPLLLLFAGALSALGWAARARGDERALVMVAIAGDPAGALDALLAERVRSAGARVSLQHDARVDPRIVLAPPKDLPPALAYVWIDVGSRDQIALVLLDARRERGLLRYIPRASGDEIAREELGHVLATAVEGLLAGETIGMTRRELAELPPLRALALQAPTQRASERPAAGPAGPSSAGEEAKRSRLRVSSAGTYELSWFDGAGRVLHGPGLAVDVQARVARSMLAGARLAVTEHLPMQIDAPPFTFRRDSWAVRGLGSIGWDIGGGFRLGGAGGIALEVERVLPLAATSMAVVAAPSTREVAVVRAELSIAYPRPIHVALRLTLDIDPTGGEIDALQGSSHVRVYGARTVRPGLSIEVGTPQ